MFAIHILVKHLEEEIFLKRNFKNKGPSVKCGQDDMAVYPERGRVDNQGSAVHQVKGGEKEAVAAEEGGEDGGEGGGEVIHCGQHCQAPNIACQQ